MISAFADGPSVQIRDDLDFPHSGIIKALHQMSRGNYAVKAHASTDLAITQSVGSSSRTQFNVAAGAYFKDGKYTAFSASTVELASNQVSPGSGHSYLLLVISGASSVALRGDNTTTSKVPQFTEGDILLATVKLANGENDNDTSRHIQFLGVTGKEENSLSIGYDASNVYTEAMSIVSDGSGATTIENKVSDQDVLFKVNDGGVSTEVMRFDASTGKVGINQGTPLSALDVDGSNSRTITYHTTATLTLGEHRFVVFNRAASATVAVTMPSISEGRIYQCSNLGAGTVTFTRADSDTFYWATGLAATTFDLTQGQMIILIGDESENAWHVMRFAQA